MARSLYLGLIILPCRNVELLSHLEATSLMVWFMWLQLDPSVMAALPLSMRRELEREYKRQQVKEPQRVPAPKPKSEEESKVLRGPVGEPKMQRDGGYPTSLKHLWIGSPPKWVHLFKNYKGAGESPRFPSCEPES